MWQRPSRWAKTGTRASVLHPRDQALAAARHDDVDGAVEAAQHLADGGAVGGRHQLDRVLRQARVAAGPSTQARWMAATECEAVGAAAQDHGVAGLEAERAGIGRRRSGRLS